VVDIAQRAGAALELWGGIECTVNRVGDRYFNQLERSGHLNRVDDLDRIAGLGIRTLRYPLLWELMEPRATQPIDWRWADERLARLRGLGIQPIVGLVHHGSGPLHTDLTQPGFAEGLARYAGRVAARYPWVEWYTPVNEPLTTARFSGLYGLWFPHGRDDRTFARALINQCRATILAMRAIRRVNPHAKLLQTDDLGRTFGTPRMQYQVDFDNERRWLGWDLLCGRVTVDHPLRCYLLEAGVGAGELDWFCEEPCAPDMVGVNHYVTSDRFLDECCELYPSHATGSNGKDRYADVEAVRAVPGFDPGWYSVLAEAWERYSLPLALSEVHLGCTREEQLRWFAEAWSAAERARACGRDVRAVTAWALFGSFNWNSLLTRDADHYEPGAFDVRTSEPRPTALAAVLRSVATTGSPSHPIIEAPGWWRRPRRTLFANAANGATVDESQTFSTPPLLICGIESERLRALEQVCEIRGIAYRTCGSVRGRASVEDLFDDFAPWALADSDGFVERADPGATDLRRTLWAAAGLREIPRLAFLGPHSVDHYSEERVQSSGHPVPLIIVARPELATGGEPQTCLHSVLHAALDLLIDGESGMWLLPSPEKVRSQRMLT
jgi:dTDP-4-dehydrorhamnose reductase